jgi:hypothetical protein
MLKKFLLPALAVVILLAACAPQADSPNGYPNPGYPSTNSETPASTTSADYLPKPSDSGLLRSEAYLDTYQLLTQESFPPQFILALKGSLPTPCHQLRASISPPDASNKVAVDVYSVVDPNAICAQVIQSFEINLPLGSFPSGHYILLINGNQATEFDA